MERDTEGWREMVRVTQRDGERVIGRDGEG